MAQDHLGLFDTPPSRKQIRYSTVIVGLLLVFLVLILTVPDVSLGQINAFIPMVDATTALTDLIIATLLYVQASVFRSRALGALATGYVFTGLMLIPHALTFPGAFAPGGLLGAGVNTTAWIYLFWRMGLPLAVLFYVLFNQFDPSAPLSSGRPAMRIGLAVLSAMALVIGITTLTTAGHDLLPRVYLSRSLSNYPVMIRSTSAVLVLAVVSMGVLFRHRRSALDIWLLVVMSAWLVQTLLFLSLKGRFTAGWYIADLVVLLSHLYLMLALIAESSRLYAQLAIATAARNRERESRLMSMDAVAAAIAHEVGQPLSAVTMSATAGLSWLKRETPDLERVKEALEATREAGNRAFEVIRGTRAMFAPGKGTATEFDINDLVRETASLQQRELKARKVTLQLDLDDTLPPVHANRGQIQQVLGNLLTNAMEAFEGMRGLPREIVMRSHQMDSQGLVIEISDTGPGILPEKMSEIFDAFVTTKKTGTGLGLSLCRTIAEDHGGRLWATASDGHGTTFHLQLPVSGPAVPSQSPRPSPDL